MKHPMQEIRLDSQGVARFRANQVVEALVEHGRATGLDINQLVMRGYDPEDYEQFFQLIGYSVSGYGDLNIADPGVVMAADSIVEALFAKSKPEIGSEL